MKRLFLIILTLVLLGGSAWGVEYYVDASRPDDTGDGLTPETAKKTIFAGKNLANGDDIINVANGTYPETGNFTVPGTNITLLGESQTGVILDLTSITGDYFQAVTSADDSFTVQYMTIKNLQAAGKAIIKVDDADNFTMSHVTLKDNERFFLAQNGALNLKFEYVEYLGNRNTTRAATINNATVLMNYCVMRASENYLGNVIAGFNVASTLTINQSLFEGHAGPVITATDAITGTIKNCIFIGNGNDQEFGNNHISGACANVTLSNCYSTNNWINNMDSEILSGFTAEAPLNISHTRFGILLLAVDDYGNWDYAKLWASIANPLGYHITHYVETENIPTVLGVEDASITFAEAKAFLDAGNDFGVHSKTHPTDITVDADNLPTSGLWADEITGAKAALEAYIQQVSGYGSWSAVSWGSPGNKGSSALADRIKIDTFQFGRMGDINNGNEYLLNNQAVFSTKPIASGFFKVAQDSTVVSPDNIGQLCENITAAGLVGEAYFHANNATFDDPDAAGIAEIFGELAKYNVLIMNAREYLAWLAVNATYSDAAGNAARWAYNFTTDNFSGYLKPTSPCINDGEHIPALYGEPDFYGDYQYNKNNVGISAKAGTPSGGQKSLCVGCPGFGL